MNAIPVILIYLLLMFFDIVPLLRKKEKRNIILYIVIMLMPLTLSINIAIGTNIPSLSTITGKIFLPLLKQIKGI